MSKFREIKNRLKEIKNKVSDAFLVDKIDSYKKLFSGNGSKKDADIVLADLTKTYDVNESCYKNHLTPEQIAVRGIIREPVLRIKKFIEYSTEDMQKLLNNINKNRNK